MFGPRTEIPSGFEHLELVRDAKVGERCKLRLNFRGNDQEQSWFDFVLFGDDGSPILKCRGLRNVVLK